MEITVSLKRCKVANYAKIRLKKNNEYGVPGGRPNCSISSSRSLAEHALLVVFSNMNVSPAIIAFNDSSSKGNAGMFR